MRAFPIVAVLLSLATMACGPPRAALTVANGPDLETLDPQLARSSAALRASRAMFAGLTRIDPATLETVPDLAASWDSPDGGFSWRFTLRKGLRWSDGSPLTAADVVASWERLAAPATAASSTSNASPPASCPATAGASRSAFKPSTTARP